MRIQWTDLKTYDIIGSGSFGRVFHGDLLGTEVAIKECVRSDSRAFDEKYFKREVDILKQSRHPNIVQFMGICKRRKRFYIITEFLPLGNLRRWIQDDSKEFGWDTRISFAIDISLALAYLHHKNIIHRDLKGENLLISENMRIKVCDFGFSRVEAQNATEMSRISYCGTDGYMAPEILLGEDFDCSVDVFSFGVILSEMMARHVVDSQHFQRVAPDMGVSPDEILFRAQPGCPIELGELAIHCVQPLPENRPVLRQIVERLTAIENVDVHVGTTLVVAPSVARAARNMMRKREVEAERAQEQAYQQARMRNGHHQQEDDSQPHHAYFDSATSSIRGQANTWRMTDESNGGSSRMIPAESIMVGSQSTYKGKRRSPTDDSTIPLVLDARYGRRERTSDHHQDKNASSDDGEDIHFRMPLWDSINSPYNQQELREWHETESVHISTIKGGTALRAWDQERGQGNGNGNGDGDGGYHDRSDRRDRRNPSELSSLQLDLDDDDGDGDSEHGGRRGGYSFSSSGSSNEDDDEEDNNSLFHEDSDDSDDEDGAVYGHSRAPGESRHLYELSSDSDETQSTNSLTESVVLALDTLEIPDLHAARQSDSQEEIQHEQTATENHRPADPSNGDSVGLERKHSLASRLLPPIPATANPWVLEASGQAPTSDDSVRDKKAKDATPTHTNESSTATMTTAPASPQRQPSVEEREMDDLSLPPAPPSKTSLLLRNNTIKSMRGGNNGGSVSPVPPEATVTVSPENKDLLSPPGQGSASTTGTTNSSATSSSISDTSSPGSTVSPDEKSSQGSSEDIHHPRQDKPEKQEKVGGGGRGFGLIRGMSDSFWGPSTSTAAPGHLTTTTTAVAIGSSHGIDSGGGTITSTLVAAMSAKTWTSGVGGFGQWMGPASSPLDEHDDISSSPPRTGKAGGLLKKHTSLKEGKQQQQQRAVANFERANGVINEGDGAAAVGAATVVVKKRAPKALTGISHRFSLVGVSALLLPKCDVCQKRLGVLPGWASKHLECDDCGYKCHPRCVDNVPKCCTSARKSGVWEIPV